MNDDLISRQAAIDVLDTGLWGVEWDKALATAMLKDLPSEQPTLFGYKIEHLAYIARVMEKEGITAEDAARTFSDLGRAVSWTIDEALQKMEEALRT